MTAQAPAPKNPCFHSDLSNHLHHFRQGRSPDASSNALKHAAWSDVLSFSKVSVRALALFLISSNCYHPQLGVGANNQTFNLGRSRLGCSFQLLARRQAKTKKEAGVLESSTLPRLIVFDLDYTLWRPELCHLDFPITPLTSLPSGGVMTASKQRIDLFPAARRALRQLADADVVVAVASRTHLGELAHELLQTIRVDDKRTMTDCITGPVLIKNVSKANHFKQMQHVIGVPLQSMLFYDNEAHNIKDCEKLGIACVYCPKGLTDDVFHEGLAKYARESCKQKQAGSKKRKRWFWHKL